MTHMWRKSDNIVTWREKGANNENETHREAIFGLLNLEEDAKGSGEELLLLFMPLSE